MTAPRTRRGQFAKGHSGNLDGRPPRKEPRLESAEENQIDVLKIGATPVTITENGKRKKVTANHAIRRQLMHAAIKGDLRAILRWEQLVEKRQTAHDQARTDIYEDYLETKEKIRNRREEVSDRYIELHHLFKHLLIHRYGMDHPKYEDDL